MKKLLVILFLALIIGIYSPQSVQADFLPEGMKGVGSLIKLEGWETVNNYWIVQPLFSEWAECDERRLFLVMESGDVCNFGQEGHCSAYYHPVAISKEYTKDIKLEIDDHNPNAVPQYSVSCNSMAYTTAIPTTTDIPLITDELVKENDPLERKDFIVTFGGIDQSRKELIMKVSQPIVRYTKDKNAADEFEKSLAKHQTRLLSEVSNAPAASPTVEATNNREKQTTVNSVSDSLKQPREQLTKNQAWLAVAGTSLFVMGSLVGFVIGKRGVQSKQAVKKADEQFNEPLSV